MNKPNLKPGYYYDNAIRAVQFIHENKFWTSKELADYLGVGKKSGYTIRDVLSRHYPIRVARRIPNGGGPRPALYTITPDQHLPVQCCSCNQIVEGIRPGDRCPECGRYA